MYVLVSAGVLGGQKRASDCPGAGVTGDCEPEDVDTEDQTLEQHQKHSEPLSDFFPVSFKELLYF